MFCGNSRKYKGTNKNLYYKGYLSEVRFFKSGEYVLTTGGKKVLPAYCHFNDRPFQ